MTTPEWYGNEDAGDARMMGAADASEFARVDDLVCEDCHEPYNDCECGTDPGEYEDHFRDDVEADADTLASAGWGTDEDYGYGGDEEW